MFSSQKVKDPLIMALEVKGSQLNGQAYLWINHLAKKFDFVHKVHTWLILGSSFSVLSFSLAKSLIICFSCF